MISVAQLSNLVKIPSKAHCAGDYPDKFSIIIMHIVKAAKYIGGSLFMRS